MIKIDAKNNEFSIDGDGETVLFEFIQVGVKVIELFSNKLQVSEETALNNLFKTMMFAIQNKQEK